MLLILLWLSALYEGTLHYGVEQNACVLDYIYKF